MKKTLVLGMALLASTALSYAQGTLNFANGAAGVNAPVWAYGSTSSAAIAGNAYAVDLYFGPAGITDPLSPQLTSAGLLVNFGTGASAGFFFGGTRTITGFAPGTSISVQVRVWDMTAGNSYAAALSSGAFSNPAGHYGYSEPIQVALGGGTIPNPNLVGLQSFSLQLVPEPSTFALAGLGAASLLLFRRRK